MAPTSIPKRIYCFCDDILRDLILTACRDRGLSIIPAPSGIDVLDLSFVGKPFAFIFQRKPSEQAALAIVERLRARGDNYPIVIISKSNSKDEFVDALFAGADDNVVVSQDCVEDLILRLVSMTQRRPEFFDNTFIRAGPFIYDTVSEVVWCSGTRCNFTPLETRMIGILIKYPGHSINKQALYNEIFPIRRSYRQSTIDDLACSIQNKLTLRIEPHYLIHSCMNTIRLGPEIVGCSFLMSTSTTLPSYLTNTKSVSQNEDAYEEPSKKKWRVANKVRLQQLEDRSVALAPIIDKLWNEGVTSTRGIAQKLIEYRIPTSTGRVKWHHPQVKMLLITLGYISRNEDETDQKPSV